jgi:hypothetical protein
MKMNSRAMGFFLASLCVPTVAAAEEVAADNPTVAMVLAERLPQTKVGDCDYTRTRLSYKRTEIHFSDVRCPT